MAVSSGSSQDAWQTRALGPGSRSARREVVIDAPEIGVWLPLARYAAPRDKGPIRVEVADAVVLEGSRIGVEAADIGVRAGEAGGDVHPRAADIGAGQTLELYLSPRLAAAIAGELRGDGDETRRLSLAFDYWGAQGGARRERLSVLLEPRARRLGEIATRLDRPAVELRLPATGAASGLHRIDLVGLEVLLAPTARFLRSSTVQCAVSVAIDVADAAVRSLVGEALILVPDAEDAGAAAIPARERAEAPVWEFAQRVRIDVERPVRQRIGLDAGLVNRRLAGLAGLGPTGRMPLRLAVGHHLTVSDETGQETGTAHALAHVDVDLIWDLTPTVLVELPGVATVLALFEKGGARDREAVVRLPVPLPPGFAHDRVPPAPGLSLPFPLRLVGGSGAVTIEPYLHIERLDTDYQALEPVTLDPDRTGSAIASAVLRLPLDRVVAGFLDHGGASVRVHLFVRRQSLEHTSADDDKIILELALEHRRQGALLCIDWGTSSIAAGFTDDRNPQDVVALPLGEVYRQASGRGGRRVAEASGAVLLDEDMDELIPSKVGLSRRLNFRAEFRPFSYLDLRARGQSDWSAARRIAALDRHYDIAMPMPVTAADPADHALDLPPLKLLLAEKGDRRALPVPVLARARGGGLVRTQEISVPDLVLDCLDELRGFYLSESLALLAGRDAGRSRHLAEALMKGDLRLVLTHPCGLGRRLIARYREAGQRLLARLDHGLLPALGAPSQTGDGVVLVPESLAAAFHALRVEIGGGDGRITQRPARIIALDLGAGTFDVSILDIAFRRGEADAWDVAQWDIKCHYGVRIGGLEIDLALTRLIDAALQALCDGRPEVTYAHAVAGDLPAHDQDGDADATDARLARRQFQVALETGKRQLTADLFAAADAGGDWVWSGQRLRLRIGRLGETGWPVVAAAGLRTPGTIGEIAGGAIRLVSAREAGSERVYLDLEFANIFEPGAAPRLERLPDVAAALAEIVALGDLISRQLPEASLGWLEDRGQTAPPGAATYLAVTGRAALWPPVFAGFQRLGVRLGAPMLASRHGATAAIPMPPEEMKQAVMLGAYHLARFQNFLEQPVPSAPLAIRRVPLAGDRSASGIFGKVDYVEDILDGREAGSIPGLAFGNLLQVARVVPGIERLDGVAETYAGRLWNDLLSSAVNPVTLSIERSMPQGLAIAVERGGPDRDIRVVTFKADWSLRCPIHDDDGSTFITDRPGRLSASAPPLPTRRRG